MRLERGVHIEGRKTQPAKISEIKTLDDQTEFLMVIYEGRKRQVRLMMKSVGCSVRYLKRIAQGPLQLGNLALGQWRALSPAEVASLKTKNAPRKPVDVPAEVKRQPASKIARRKAIDKRSEHEYQTRGFNPRERNVAKPKRTFNNYRKPKNDHSE
jgi:hypothetical protein